MNWLRRHLLGSPPPPPAPPPHEDDDAVLRDLHSSFGRVRTRTERLEAELRRISAQLREAQEEG